MPQINDKNGKPSNFTDTNVARLKVDATTWFTDPSVKGLRLCVTAGGTKTWYVNKWDPHAEKVRAVKLGQWADKGTHCAWAKSQVGKVAHDIEQGNVKNRAEKAVVAEAIEAEKAGIPTLREAFELEVENRLTLDEAYGGPRAAETMQNYRSPLFRYIDAKHLDSRVTEFDHVAVQRELDAVAKAHPFAAHKLNIALGYAHKRAKRVLRIESFPFMWPSLERNPTMGKRTVDYTIPWADRWDEIDGVENEHKRLLWMVRWFTGQRERMLRGLRWADVDLKAGTILVHSGLKHEKKARLIAMADQVKSWFERLWEIREDDCDWVFPSRRRIDGKRGPLDALDRLPLSAPSEIRHLWNEATQDVDTREMVLRWLTGQKLAQGETKNLGLYGTVPVDRQRKVANEIASVISTRIGMTPANVVELQKVRA